MAKKKVVSRAAAQTAVKKKWSGRLTSAKSASRKKVESKARGVPAAKSKPAKKARPKQRIAISHHREEDFKADGLRTYAKYRDLGIADATHDAEGVLGAQEGPGEVGVHHRLPLLKREVLEIDRRRAHGLASALPLPH